MELNQILKPEYIETLEGLTGKLKIKLSEGQQLVISKEDGKNVEFSVEESVENKIVKLDQEEGSIEPIFKDSVYKLKIPIAKIGKWTHPVYGVIENSQETLNQIVKIFNENRLGFEPPLFIGHPEDIGGSASSEGILLAVEQEGDLLYGYWSTNEKVYTDVLEGRYRYSSGEFVRSYVDKETTEELGVALLGMALTNRPFMKLPKVQTLNYSMVDMVMCFTNNITTNTESIINTIDSDIIQEEKTFIEEKTEYMSDNLEQKIEMYAEQIKAVEVAYKQQLTEAMDMNRALQARLEKAEQKLKDQHISARLELLNGLSLPDKTKELYTEHIKAGSLGDAEDSVLESLKELSATLGTQMFSQIGSNTVSEQMAAMQANPYEDVIKRNREVAQQRKASTL